MARTKRNEAAPDVERGLSIKQAAAMFRADRDVLPTLIARARLQPIGTRTGSPTYDAWELASLLVPPRWTDEEWETVLHKGHFPTQLVKDFWAAKKARQDYLKTAGELWHTADVIDIVSELMKTVAMGVKLVADNVEREQGLTPDQRVLITELTDEILLGAHKAVDDKFREKLNREQILRYEDLTGEVVDEDKGQQKDTERRIEDL